MSSLSSLGEDALIRLLTASAPSSENLIEGPGDDCAIVRRNEGWDTLLKTDAVVEGIHFTPDTKPHLIGRKALARAVSDIAAMGGIPEHALVTVLVHASRPVEVITDIYNGIKTLARKFGISLAGGETSSLPSDGLALSITLTGRVEHGRAWRRSTATPGDLLAVTGRLGGAFPSGRHLVFTPRVNWARSLQEHGPHPSAAMDLSDGLGTDLPRFAQASSCGFEIEPAHLPRHHGCDIHSAICDGEDYELLLSFPPSALPDYRPGKHVPGLDFPLTVIGRMTAGTPGSLPSGWRHFIR